MLKIVTLGLLMLSSLLLCGQNLNMTFTASGESGKVDSIKATNLRTNEHVSMPGLDTLILALNTGIETYRDPSGQGIVYPNPFRGRSTFVANIREAETVTVELYTLAGQMIARTQAHVQPGSHAFALSVSRMGVYMISLTTGKATTGYKVICTETTGGGNLISYTGKGQGFLFPELKSTTIYTLGYMPGDIILYRCRGGIHATIIADSPKASTNYTVEFATCADPDGKNYPIVKIGTQTWMAENLAWLPSVSKSANGSDSLKYYYVYNFEDSVVSAAKNTAHYRMYGALYNWNAAMNQQGRQSTAPGTNRAVCPQGWHLPDDSEWKTLEMSLGMSQQDADSMYLRNSGNAGTKLMSTWNWIGFNPGSNGSGFTALPAGYRNTHGGFRSLNDNALFWTATPYDTVSWYRSLDDADSGVYRLRTLRSQGLSVRCVKDAM